MDNRITVAKEKVNAASEALTAAQQEFSEAVNTVGREQLAAAGFAPGEIVKATHWNRSFRISDPPEISVWYGDILQVKLHTLTSTGKAHATSTRKIPINSLEKLS